MSRSCLPCASTLPSFNTTIDSGSPGSDFCSPHLRKLQFLQYEDERVLDKDAGNGYALALSTEESCAVFSRHGLVAFLHAFDKLMAVGKLGCGDDLVIRGISSVQADVPHHAGVEECHILEYDRDLAEQGVCEDPVMDSQGIPQRSCAVAERAAIKSPSATTTDGFVIIHSQRSSIMECS